MPPVLCIAAALLAFKASKGVALAQQTTAPLTLEVVSVKPSPPDCKLIMIGPSDEGFHLHCMTLVLLMQYAYNLNLFEDGHLIGLPPWAVTEHFDLDAPIQGSDRARFEALTPPEKARLLQPTLADRFALRAHQDQREMPVYALIPGKSANKLKPTNPNDPVTDHKPTLMRKGRDRLEAYHCTMQDLLSFISPLRGRPIVDRTGLTGSYDFTLSYAPESSHQPTADEDASPSIFTAVQEQLGLRLVTDKALQPVVVIESISHPTAN